MDFISVGKITHSAPSGDYSLLLNGRKNELNLQNERGLGKNIVSKFGISPKLPVPMMWRNTQHSTANFLAGHQFEGRGREENSWSDSNDGGQLLCSWKFKLTHPPQHISAPIIGLCLYSALKKDLATNSIFN